MPLERFVLIDDNEADNFFHRLAIERAGFTGEILVFERPQDGLAFLVDDGISRSTCVLLDISMPQMSGFDVARALTAALHPRAPLAVHLLSSSDWREDRARAAEIPLISQYRVKPLRTPDVQTLLAAWPA